METNWRARLRAMRRELGISQGDLAAAAGLGTETVRGYENGRRNPRRQHLDAILLALHAPNAVANEIRDAAGFAPVPSVFTHERDRHYYYARDELQVFSDGMPWPEFAVDDSMEVVSANAAVEAVWRVDYRHERSVRSRAQMNVLSVASDNHFADRVENWEDVIGMMVSIAKARYPTPHALDGNDTYFNEVLAEFAKGDPAFLARLMHVWTTTEARDSKCHWAYRITWNDAEFGQMRFIAICAVANEPAATFFNSWMPVDAESWTVLERVKSNWAAMRAE